MPRRPPFDLLPPDDLALWAKISGTVTPLASERRAVEQMLPPATLAVAMPASPALTRTLPQGKPPLPLAWQDEGGISRGDKTRIKQGVLRPTLSIDLHGMTVSRAEQALLAFLAKALRDGHDWVEIITGHGRRLGPTETERESGVLKRLLPEWLNRPAYRLHVKRVLSAPKARGGAVWVALKH